MNESRFYFREFSSTIVRNKVQRSTRGQYKILRKMYFNTAIETYLCFVFKKRLKHFSIDSLIRQSREKPQTTVQLPARTRHPQLVTKNELLEIYNSVGCYFLDLHIIKTVDTCRAFVFSRQHKFTFYKAITSLYKVYYDNDLFSKLLSESYLSEHTFVLKRQQCLLIVFKEKNVLLLSMYVYHFQRVIMTKHVYIRVLFSETILYTTRNIFSVFIV